MFQKQRRNILIILKMILSNYTKFSGVFISGDRGFAEIKNNHMRVGNEKLVNLTLDAGKKIQELMERENKGPYLRIKMERL